MQPIHSFHIPVMGLAYTVDSPIKVARFGIASVISIIEDRLIEMMRKHYYQQMHETYVPISPKEPDYRARRISDYLNLVARIVSGQVAKIRSLAFNTNSELDQYFEMLPSENELRALYFKMKETHDEKEKHFLQDYLRKKVTAGSIDVNIMTKVDGNNSHNPGTPVENGTDAVSALRGYASSDLNDSSIILSAGLNPRLFNYLETLPAFFASEWGKFSKKIVIKVSDYRSALIQGKYLAKKGIWVSEFRIESGLNCGGHAFATDGYLMGPILEEFSTKRDELIATLHGIYNSAIKAKGQNSFETPHPIKITAQGGIGTYAEDNFLLHNYDLDGTGWGTPFLLCPEATTVDHETLQQLSKARTSDVVLSKNSPLGIRFHYLKGTSSEVEKMNRIKVGKPGSPCTEKHLAFNTEFTSDPVCTASRKYQALKIEHLRTLQLPPEEFERQLDEVYAKECLCVGLSNSASLAYSEPFLKRLKSVTICPGPNIAYFSKIVSLKEMTDHIYGRTNLLTDIDRPHMFINELQLYITYLKEQVETAGLSGKLIQYCVDFAENLLEGIGYYKALELRFENIKFHADLEFGEYQINTILLAMRVNEKAKGAQALVAS